MRKIVLAMFGLMAALIVSLTVTSCIETRRHVKNSFSSELTWNEHDSIFVMDMVQEYTNPSFKTAIEAISFREDVREGARIDSVFNSLSNSTLRYVCDVCARKYGKFRKKCIVQEYTENKDIYDNLPQTQSQPTQLPPPTTQQPQKEEPVVLNPTEGEPTRVGNTVSIQIKHQDTVIDGRPHTIETTTKTIEK